MRSMCGVVVCSLALAACGSSGGSSATSGGSSSLTHDEFVSRANALCSQANSQIQKLPAFHSLSDFEAFAAGTQPIARNLLSELRKLNPPSEDRAAVQKLTNDLEAEIPLLSQLQSA